jgi:hypothetical protein
MAETSLGETQARALPEPGRRRAIAEARARGATA